MKKLVFLNREILNNDEFTDCIIVPLNSVAMRDVLQNGMDYIKIEEFIDYDFCEKNKEKIWHVFQHLLDKADDILSQVYDNYKIKCYGPFNLFAMGIRQTFDTMVQNWIIFTNIILKIRPIEIKLLTCKIAFANSELAAARFLDTLYKTILESIATKNNIDFMFHSIKGGQSGYLKKISTRSNLLLIILKLIKKSRIYYYNKIGIHEAKINKINQKALFVQHNWGCYYYSQYFSHVINDSTIEAIIMKNEPIEYYKKISYTELLDQLSNEIVGLNKLFGFDVKFILEATLKRYINKIPLIISRALRYEDYLIEINPRFVFFTNLHENMLPFQMALCWNNHIIKVMKDHGDAMFDATVWRNNELKPIDLYFTEFEEFARYLRINAELANIRVRCEYDGVRLNKYYRKIKAKRKLIYVPGFFDPRFSLDMDMIPQPLFFRIQIRILQVLNQQKDIDDVVYKCLPPGQHDFHYPVPEYIKSNFENIRISHKLLKDELRDAMYCLLDSPSSAMWEAINMNVPCQTLIWRKIHLRHTGADYYDKFITFYDSDIDVSEKLHSILTMKRFHTIDINERKLMKRSPGDITAILNEISSLSVS